MQADGPNSRWLAAAIAAAIGLATAALYAPAVRHEFLDYDDQLYVTRNELVQQGLAPQAVARAFSPRTTVAGNWQPLTLISHMADVELYGLSPAGHHATSVALHAAAAALLFLAFRGLTGQIGPSAVLALLWAWHPLRVESVAWIAERKDVLSGVFWMLTLWAYAAYARCGGRARYAAVGGCLAAGLLSKPTVVTLPCVLLLLDAWPLADCTRSAGWRRRLFEKLPLLAAALAVSWLTLAAQQGAGSLAALDDTPWTLRINNALQSYVAYLGKTFWPVDLAVFYPLRARSFTAANAMLAASGLAGLTLVAAALYRRLPFLLIGWLWYLGVMVPMIGLVQVGAQAMADRYTYLPQIGLLAAVVWLLTHGQRLLVQPGLRAALCVALAGGLLLLAVQTRRQLRHWHDTQSLFAHALEVTEKNYQAHLMLANQFVVRGQFAEALQHYDAALAIKPNLAEAHYNKAYVFLQLEQHLDRAAWHLAQALQLGHEPARTHAQLGRCLLLLDRSQQAESHLQRAVSLDPNNETALTALGTVWLRKDRAEAAIALYERVLATRPEAARKFPSVAGHLAWIRATHPNPAYRDGQKAMALATAAAEATDLRQPRILDALAAACAETGHFDRALQYATTALTLLEKNPDAAATGQHARLAEALRLRIAIYQQRRPYRDVPPGQELW